MITMNETRTNYLYLISARREFFELCAMEMRHIFGRTTHKNYHLSETLIDINKSPFIKGVVSILYKNSSIDVIEKKMIADQISYNNYKIHYHKFDDVAYQDRLNSMRMLGTTIHGDFSIKNPDIEFILTRINGEWIFGEFNGNSNEWKKRRKKPHSYSHSLDIVIAKAAINIVIENNLNQSLIDPCCGIGTIIIEGRCLGINTSGYELNPLVKQKCNLNLKHYGLEPDVIKINMLESTKCYDASILDLPYGHYSNITTQEQIALIRKLKEISNRSVIITMEDMSDSIHETDWKIIDSCEIKKSNTFKRFVFLCQK